MSRVVHLHIGAPKTGTTYVQDRLAKNVRSLNRHGVHFPSQSRMANPMYSQFRAALDLLGQDWGGPPGHAQGAWAGLVDRVRGLDGNVIISHEILAGATVEQAETAHRDLQTEDLRIVYSARDLARQLPAAWQESVKQGRSWTLAEFLRRAERGNPYFMRSFDIPQVLSTWGAGLDPQQVTLVVLPPKGAPEDTLWLRMCEALEIEPGLGQTGLRHRQLQPERGPDRGAATPQQAAGSQGRGRGRVRRVDAPPGEHRDAVQ